MASLRRVLRALAIPCLLIALISTPLAPFTTSSAAEPVAHDPLTAPAYIDYMQRMGESAPGTPTTSAAARQNVADWTVMVYMAADNDLESYALADLDEMEFIGSTERVNVVVQLDRAAGYDTTNEDWTGARRYFVNFNTNVSQIGSEVVAELGEINTGDPATLVDFTTWAITTYPAERYALIIWDHGGSWLGVAVDVEADDGLQLPELDVALSAITEQTGAPLEVVGFDACLMGSFEVYRTVSPYAHYAVASTELIPGNGWDYLGLLDALNRDGAEDGVALGRAAVDSFMVFYTDVVTNYSVFNLGVVDLTLTGDVITALVGIAESLGSATANDLDAMIAARNGTTMYGGFDDPQYVDVWSSADMLEFLQLLAEGATSDALRDAATRACETAAGMLIYYRGNTSPDAPAPDAPVRSGIAIYFPRNAALFQQKEAYAATLPSDMAQWNTFLGTFFERVRQTSVEGAVGVEGVTVEDSQATVGLGLSGTGRTKATFMIHLDIGQRQQIMVQYQEIDLTTQPDREDVAWDGRIAYLTSGTLQTPVLILWSAQNPDVGVINGGYFAPGGEPVKAHLVVDRATDTITSVWGLREIDGALLPFEITPQPGDIFHPAWVSLGPGGRLINVPANVRHVIGTELPTVTYEFAPRGGYRVVIQAEDAAGNVQQADLTVAITENDGTTFTVEPIDLDDDDPDGDGVTGYDDNCPYVANPDQADLDDDFIGDECDLFDDYDLDGDGIDDYDDNCPGLYNPDQGDGDGDFVGDDCSGFGDWLDDVDADGVPDAFDNCPDDWNPYQVDDDDDGIGDWCDELIHTYFNGGADWDEDGVPDLFDTCPNRYDPDQADGDGDGVGDMCAGDQDGDGIPDDADNCPDEFNPLQLDEDASGAGDACEYMGDDFEHGDDEFGDDEIIDLDGDGVLDDYDDNCPGLYNPDQLDADGDGIGTACDPDEEVSGDDDDAFPDEEFPDEEPFEEEFPEEEFPEEELPPEEPPGGGF